MGLDFVIAHTGIWIDLYSIIAIIILILVILYFVIRRHKLVKKEEELESLLSEKYEREKYKSLDDEMDANHTEA